MIFYERKIKGLYVIEQELKSDQRGYFSRNFCFEEFFKATGVEFNIKQINQSWNKKVGTLRGMHMQIPPKSEDKIIQCLYGKVFDVAVDLRKGSKTYGQWVGEELSADNKKMFLIPKGFAHGLLTLTENCLMQYFLSEFYSPEYEKGFSWNDPYINIKWPIEPKIMSEKDKKWPYINK